MNYCGINYVDYCWSAGINGGYVVNDKEVIGTSNTGNAAQIFGFMSGMGGNLAGHLSQMSDGGIRIHVNTIDVTKVYIFVSLNNNNDWRQVYASVQSMSNGWYTIYAYSSDPYNYVSISCYDPNYRTNIFVDEIGANY
ncbi:MAG: hypothetical protein LBH62_08155 [Nitrososphaerota archaeon]|nr:hypothetical protein [Nitrososphaerota archaeon]